MAIKEVVIVVTTDRLIVFEHERAVVKLWGLVFKLQEPELHFSEKSRKLVASWSGS